MRAELSKNLKLYMDVFEHHMALDVFAVPDEVVFPTEQPEVRLDQRPQEDFFLSNHTLIDMECVFYSWCY